VLPVVHHEVRPGRWPYVTVCLIGLNLLAFVFELTLGARLVPFLQEWGVVPGRIQGAAGGHDVLTVGSAAFLHMGVLQVFGTMWFLWVFGDAVEDAFGPWLFLAVYLAGGFVGTVLSVAVAHASSLPVVGAGGAVSAVMAASLVLWPKARLKIPSILLFLYALLLLYQGLVLIGMPSLFLGGPVIFVLSVIAMFALTRRYGGFLAGLLNMTELPAWFVLGLFVSMLLFIGYLSVAGPGLVGPLGYAAYLGGFAAGALLAWLLPKHPILLADRPLLG
jgi:membrane associated rhomboid family serine protease